MSKTFYVSDSIGLGRQVAEAGELGLEQEFHGANGAVSMLGHDHLGDSPVGSFWVVVLIAIDHQHEVGVLLNRVRLEPVAEYRSFVGVLFHVTAELRQGDANLR